MSRATRPAVAPVRLPAASFRLRILFRGVFLLLALATIALAIVLLQDEKERSYRSYQQALQKTHVEILERLRQPAGMLALLNPGPVGIPPLRPLVLPFPTLELEDLNAVHQAVDQSACSVRYVDGSAICAGVGASPRAAGFLYLVGTFTAPPIGLGDSGGEAEAAYRMSIDVAVAEARQSLTAAFQPLSGTEEPTVRGRISAAPSSSSEPAVRREFRGSFWQSARCAGEGVSPECARRVFYAVRLPVKAWRERAASRQRPAWPPADLAEVQVRVVVLGPGEGARLFDSDSAGAKAPASFGDALQSLRPGESLTISRQDVQGSPAILVKGRDDPADRGSPLLLRLVSGLPVASAPSPIELHETVITPLGGYEVVLAGDARSINPGLGAVATRISWYVSAMLVATALAWLVIEVGLIRRVTVLSRRAAAVSADVRRNAPGAYRIGQLDVSDLRGSDELGILAGGLADLLQRVKDDVEREELRARQEREMLEAVGHEIMSPLQSLMVLFPDPGDPPHRYVQRMRQAVAALYGQASPREALEAAQLELQPLNLDDFLYHVASNAAFAGLVGVRYERLNRPVIIRADEFRLEDVVTHILRNADRHRVAGSTVELSLRTKGSRAQVRIYNQGPQVDDRLLESMFEYGVRDVQPEDAPQRRGQGLFVARTYMAKMAGTVSARNEEGGVAFYLEMPLEPDLGRGRF